MNISVNYAAIFAEAWAAISTPSTLAYIALGTFCGLVFGCLPGLTATMAVCLFIPLTYVLPAGDAMATLCGCYMGGIAGGAISAILLHIPGTSSSVVTLLDGYPMAQQGRGGRAVGWAAFASGWGSLVSWLTLVLLAPYLAKVCVSFSSPEYAALAVFGLTIVAAVSGESLVKGLVVAMIGILATMIGFDPIFGTSRFSFGTMNLLGGIDKMPAIIGLFSIPEILRNCASTNKGSVRTGRILIRDIVPPFIEQWRHKWSILRSSIIGTIIGVIPATGSGIAAYLAYDQAKRFSKHPETFGTGEVDGIIASEAANNGVCGGALIPMLTLGIPGDGVSAVMMGGLMVHGLAPGPSLFTKQPDVIGSIFTGVLLASIFLVLFQVVGIKLFIKVLNVPICFLAPILLTLTLIGCYALRNNPFDILIGLLFGAIGYIMEGGGFPASPMVLGLVLGHLFESEIRLALQSSLGSVSIFFKRPVACIVLIIAVVVASKSVIDSIRKSKTESANRE